MFKNISIGNRLWIGFSLILLISAGVSFFIIYQMESLSNLTSLMYRHPFAVSNAVLRIDGNIVRIHRSMKDVTLASNEGEIDEAVQLAASYEKEVYKDFEIIEERFLGEKKMFEEAKQIFEDWKPIRDEVVSLVEQGEREQAANITKGKGARHVEKLTQAMIALNDFAQNKASSFLGDALETRSQTLGVAYTLVTIMILAGAMLIIMLIRSINRPLAILMDAVLDMSTGNLDQKIPVGTQDEIGQLANAFNNMAGKLKSSYSNLEEKVSQRTQQLAMVNKDLEKTITGLRKAEEELRLHAQALHNMVEGVNITQAKDGIIFYVNPAFEEMLGYSEGELIGKHISIINAPTEKSSEEISAEIISDLNEKGSWEGEIENLRKDGTTVLTYTKVSSFRHSIHNTLWITVQEDITERKQAEEERLKLKKLESVGVLAGGIAHDFNNLLTGLFGNIEIAKMFLSVDHKSYKFLEIAGQSMENATNLTKQLLTFAKGGAPIKETLSIGSVITETARFSLRGSRAKLQTSIAPDLWLIDADKGQLSQVISNMVINAEQAMPAGGIVTIAAENIEMSDGRYIKITVQDEGEGIIPQHLDKIFDPYFTTKQEGSGLGLAITHSIVSKHNGQITVDTHPKQGTIFTVYLPAAEKEEERTTEKSSVKREPPPDSSVRILVMDDEEVVREIIRAMLNRLGYKVTLTVDGLEAIAEYQASYKNGKPYDIVITDLTIPGGMGGQKTAQEILKINPQAKIIVSSGYATDPVMANYNEYGLKGIVVKPYTFVDLKKVIQQVLKM